MSTPTIRANTVQLFLLCLSTVLVACNLEQIPITRPSNPAPNSISGQLAVNESGTTQVYDTVHAIYYPNWHGVGVDSTIHPVMLIIADSSLDTLELSLANVKPDTATYAVANDLALGSTYAYFSAPLYFPPPDGYVATNYFLVPYGHISITTFDTTQKLISGSFSFDQNVGRPMVRMYLDGTFKNIAYSVVR